MGASLVSVSVDNRAPVNQLIPSQSTLVFQEFQYRVVANDLDEQCTSRLIAFQFFWTHQKNVGSGAAFSKDCRILLVVGQDTKIDFDATTPSCSNYTGSLSKTLFRESS